MNTVLLVLAVTNIITLILVHLQTKAIRNLQGNCSAQDEPIKTYITNRDLKDGKDRESFLNNISKL